MGKNGVGVLVIFLIGLQCHWAHQLCSKNNDTRHIGTKHECSRLLNGLSECTCHQGQQSCSCCLKISDSSSSFSVIICIAMDFGDSKDYHHHHYYPDKLRQDGKIQIKFFSKLIDNCCFEPTEGSASIKVCKSLFRFARACLEFITRIDHSEFCFDLAITVHEYIIVHKKINCIALNSTNIEFGNEIYAMASTSHLLAGKE